MTDDEVPDFIEGWDVIKATGEGGKTLYITITDEALEYGLGKGGIAHFLFFPPEDGLSKSDVKKFREEKRLIRQIRNAIEQEEFNAFSDVVGGSIEGVPGSSQLVTHDYFGIYRAIREKLTIEGNEILAKKSEYKPKPKKKESNHEVIQLKQKINELGEKHHKINEKIKKIPDSISYAKHTNDEGWLKQLEEEGKTLPKQLNDLTTEINKLKDEKSRMELELLESQTQDPIEVQEETNFDYLCGIILKSKSLEGVDIRVLQGAVWDYLHNYTPNKVKDQRERFKQYSSEHFKRIEKWKKRIEETGEKNET